MDRRKEGSAALRGAPAGRDQDQCGRTFRMSRITGVLAAVLTISGAYAEEFNVDPSSGNSTFNAVFDARLGERINATSSAVECSVTYDEKGSTMSGTCSVPLTTIKVDNEDTKTEHFQQWATNKKMEPKDCKFEAKFTSVKVGRLFHHRARERQEGAADRSGRLLPRFHRQCADAALHAAVQDAGEVQR